MLAVKLHGQMTKSKPGKRKESRSEVGSAVAPKFATLVKGFAKDRQVTYGGKGFGSSGLKVNGKLFVLISSRGQFVAKLPRKRVDELVRLGKGEHFCQAGRP